MNCNVFICQNPFQIMVAMTIIENLPSYDTNDIIITGMASGLKEREARLKQINIFRNVWYIDRSKCNDYSRSKLVRNIRKEKCEIFGCYLKESKILTYDYTDIYAMDLTCMTNHICREVQKRGKTPCIHLFEEGFGCYTEHYRKHLFNQNLVRDITSVFVNKIEGTIPAKQLIGELQLFEPELLNWTPPFRIKKIKKPSMELDSNYRKNINYIFDFNNNDDDNYKYPIIYFEDCIYQDTGNKSDFRVIKEIFNYVGKKNMIIKLHPRTKNNRFEEIGIDTMKKQGIPWEVIAMNLDDNEKHIFVTCTSSSIVTYSLLFDKSYLSILLYKCASGFTEKVDPEILTFLENYAQLKPDIIYIPNTLEDALQKIKCALEE